MRRTQRIAGAGLAAGLALLLTAAAGPKSPLPVGQPAPAVGLVTLDGDPLRLAKLRGKVVLVDFWASWCGPCVAELPALKEIVRRYGGQPFELVSISVDSNGTKLRDFVSSHELTWTQCWDANGDAELAFGVSVLPTAFLLDPTGRIRYLHTGWRNGRERELRREIDAALADAKAPGAGAHAAASTSAAAATSPAAAAHGQR